MCLLKDTFQIDKDTQISPNFEKYVDLIRKAPINLAYWRLIFQAAKFIIL